MANLEENEIKSNVTPELEKMLSEKYLKTDDIKTENISFIRKPKNLFTNIKVFVFLYSLNSFFILAHVSYYSGIISTLEKCYQISSKTAGIISIGSEIFQVAFMLFLSYYTGSGHRPRWIAFAGFAYAFVCLAESSPHFIFNINALRNSTNHNLCQEENNCPSDEASTGPTIILFVANLGSGFANSIYLTTGCSYIDDNVAKSKIPLYMGVAIAFRILGSTFGYILSSYTLKFYVSPFQIIDIDSSNPRWVGAWWLGYIILAIVFFVISFLLLQFPRSLQHNLTKEDNEKHVKRSVQEFVNSFKRLIKNPVLMCASLSSIFYWLAFTAFWMFLPKYIEIQYQQSTFVANTVTGSVAMLMYLVGLVITSLVIKKIKASARSLARWQAIVNTVVAVLFITAAFIGCEEVENKFYSEERASTLTSPCVDECSCDYVKYSPVCSSTGQTFVSPCHAGCKSYQRFSNGTELFSDCMCAIFNQTIEDVNYESFATPGLCPTDCQTVFITFMVIFGMSRLLGSGEKIIKFLMSTRSVEIHDKTLSIGVIEFLKTVFALMPAPIIFGAIFDSTCLIWGQTCGAHGNCWLYDTASLRFILNFTAGGFALIGAIFDVLVWYFCEKIELFDKDEEE